MLSKKTKYALHALVYLAKNGNIEKPVLISEIAQKAHIPKKFLETILLDLKNVGYLASKKGKGGGYYLRKSPDEIHLTQIIRLFDGAIALLSCVSLNYYQKCMECENEDICGLRKTFMEVRDETLKVLENNTLATILAKEKIITLISN